LEVGEEKNKIICKYGKSDDLRRRLEEHEDSQKYEYVKLLFYVIIEETKLTEVEGILHDFFLEYKPQKNKKIETVHIVKSFKKNVKELYGNLEKQFSSESTILNEKIRDMETKEKIEKYKNEAEIAKKDLENEKLKNELKDKEIEFLKLKYELFVLKTGK
jgi:hypothetical protein